MEEPFMAEEAEIPGGHPAPGLLERFMQGDVAAPERRRVVRHLLTGCPRCVAVTRRIWAFGGGGIGGIAGIAGIADLVGRPPAPAPATPATPDIAPQLPASYEAAIAHALAVSRRREEELAGERLAAPGLLAKLLEQPWEKRLALVRRHERYQSVALADLLLDRCHELRRRPHLPTEAPGTASSSARIELAELAAAVAERLDPEACGPSVVRDLLGRAWVEAGEARRLAGDLPGAERAARSAAPLLAGGEPAEQLDLLRLEAAIAADHGQFDEADRLLDRAAQACRAAGEPHLQASALVERGTLHAAAERYASAIELLREGAELLEAPGGNDPEEGDDAEADSALLASALHRQAALLFEVGRSGEALEVAGRLHPLYERLGNRAGLLRLRWLLGKIEEDEAALLQAREGLLAEGLGLAGAQISLDLAVLYARKGRSAEIRRLAEEIFPIFRHRDLRRESMAALLVFRRAVETESASLEFLVEVARYLLGSRRTRWGSL
jgi:tetratricopeptide (TPR) repeat protein